MYEYSECAYDTTGKVVATADYGAYGAIRRSSGSVPIYGWCGMLGVERDAATGLLFMRARYYSPMLGRFITRDPIGLSAGDVNWYRYCANAPVLLIDPYGQSWSTILCKGLIRVKFAADIVSVGLGLVAPFAPPLAPIAMLATTISVATNAAYESIYGDGYSWDEAAMDIGEIIVGATPLKNVFTSKASTLTNVIGAAGVISAQTGNVISLISSGSKAGSL